MVELNTEFGFFWQAKTSMIYPTLRKLKNRGWIKENEVKSSENLSFSKYYELTKEGLKKLTEFRGPPHPTVPFFQGAKFKPPSSPFKKFEFWEKFVDANTIIENLVSYRKHLVKELERIDEKVEEVREKEEYKEAFRDLW